MLRANGRCAMGRRHAFSWRKLDADNTACLCAVSAEYVNWADFFGDGIFAAHAETSRPL